MEFCMSRARILALSFVAALALGSGALAQGVAVGAVARAALALEQVERAAQPVPQATQAARRAVRAATASLNPPAAKAVRLAIPLLNPPAARAKIASIPQGRELGRGTLVRALKSQRSKWHERNDRLPGQR